MKAPETAKGLYRLATVFAGAVAALVELEAKHDGAESDVERAVANAATHALTELDAHTVNQMLAVVDARTRIERAQIVHEQGGEAFATFDEAMAVIDVRSRREGAHTSHTWDYNAEPPGD